MYMLNMSNCKIHKHLKQQPQEGKITVDIWYVGDSNIANS